MRRLCIILISFLVVATASAKPKKYKFATGGSTGTYFAIGKSLNGLKGHKFDVLNTKGSYQNIDMLRKGEAHFAIVQLDILLNSAIVLQDIRLVLPIYQEEIHLVSNNKIKGLIDLKGKKIAVGAKGSGTRGTAMIILEALDLDKAVTIDNSGSKDALANILSGDTDAMFYVAGAPVKLFASLSAKKGKNIKMMHIDGRLRRYLTSDFYPYKNRKLAAKTYKWQKKPVRTISVQSVLVTRTSVPRKYVKKLVKAIFAKQKDLATAHPKWNELSRELTKGLVHKMGNEAHPGVAALFPPPTE